MIFHLFRVAHSVLREHRKAKRSAHWAVLRDAYLRASPVCAACGKTKRLQVHHVKPFHLKPELELDPGNLIALCMGDFECHLRIGHGDSFEYYVESVREFAMTVRRDSSMRENIEQEAKAIRMKL